ncbi:transposase [Flavobacterium sp. RHBU_24]|uniref:transposase n=1 Tax=Flavobacterium sp. RHBU_24 TaxID=3391185 RepID=UPI003984B669
MKLEPLAKDNMYHIYNRGINGESIFLSDENKRYFLSLLDKYMNESGDVYAYCLMDNHFHLLLSIREEGEVVTQQLSNLFNAYAKAMNKSIGRTGSLFEKHFRRIRIDNEDYLKQVIVYIHLNPKHHFDLDFSTFRYSSYTSFLSEKDTKLKREDVLRLFEDRQNYEYVHYQKNDLINEQLTLE